MLDALLPPLDMSLIIVISVLVAYAFLIQTFQSLRLPACAYVEEQTKHAALRVATMADAGARLADLRMLRWGDG